MIFSLKQLAHFCKKLEQKIKLFSISTFWIYRCLFM